MSYQLAVACVSVPVEHCIIAPGFRRFYRSPRVMREINEALLYVYGGFIAVVCDMGVGFRLAEKTTAVNFIVTEDDIQRVRPLFHQ